MTDYTSNATRYAMVKRMDLDELGKSVKMLNRPVDPFTGQIVLVEEDKMVVDRKSGISYVTQKTWDDLRSQLEQYKP